MLLYRLHDDYGSIDSLKKMAIFKYKVAIGKYDIYGSRPIQMNDDVDEDDDTTEGRQISPVLAVLSPPPQQKHIGQHKGLNQHKILPSTRFGRPRTRSGATAITIGGGTSGSSSTASTTSSASTSTSNTPNDIELQSYHQSQMNARLECLSDAQNDFDAALLLIQQHHIETAQYYIKHPRDINTVRTYSPRLIRSSASYRTIPVASPITTTSTTTTSTSISRILSTSSLLMLESTILRYLSYISYTRHDWRDALEHAQAAAMIYQQLHDNLRYAGEERTERGDGGRLADMCTCVFAETGCVYDGDEARYFMSSNY